MKRRRSGEVRGTRWAGGWGVGVVTGEVACSGGGRVQTGEGSPGRWTEPGLLSEISSIR